MIRSKLFIVADRAIRDSDSGNLSIINILDDISAEAFPVIIPRLTIVGFVIKDSEDSDTPSLRFKLLNNEKTIGDHHIKVDFRGKNKTRAIIQLGGIPIPEPGELHFILTNEKEEEIDRYTINLRLREEIKVLS